MSRAGEGWRLHAGNRLGAWILTGPLGRVAAFLADVAVYWWRWLRERNR